MEQKLVVEPQDSKAAACRDELSDGATCHMSSSELRLRGHLPDFGNED